VRKRSAQVVNGLPDFFDKLQRDIEILCRLQIFAGRGTERDICSPLFVRLPVRICRFQFLRHSGFAPLKTQTVASSISTTRGRNFVCAYASLPLMVRPTR
jgi:hypothetical protein